MRIHPGMVIGTILGFLFWRPVGLAFLFFTLRSTNMGCWNHQDGWANKMERMRGRMERRGFGFGGFGPPSIGNRAFRRIPRRDLEAPRRGADRIRGSALDCLAGSSESLAKPKSD
jgi:hypothetical protein